MNREKITHRKIFQDDYGPALNWYRAAIQNVNAVDEEDGRLDPQLTVPVLMITASNDPIGGPKFAEHVKNFAADLTKQQINSGQWVQLEKRRRRTRPLQSFRIAEAEVRDPYAYEYIWQDKDQVVTSTVELIAFRD